MFQPRYPARRLSPGFIPVARVIVACLGQSSLTHHLSSPPTWLTCCRILFDHFAPYALKVDAFAFAPDESLAQEAMMTCESSSSRSQQGCGASPDCSFEALQTEWTHSEGLERAPAVESDLVERASLCRRLLAVWATRSPAYLPRRSAERLLGRWKL